MQTKTLPVEFASPSCREFQNIFGAIIPKSSTGGFFVDFARAFPHPDKHTRIHGLSNNDVGRYFCVAGCIVEQITGEGCVVKMIEKSLYPSALGGMVFEHLFEVACGLRFGG
jgi:hypothetical protein